jgi:hypothetical protein
VRGETARPGVLERIVRNDASVCGQVNPAAFAKLHSMVVMHYLVRNRSVEELGQAQTIAIERDVIERLAKAYGDLANGTSSA